MVQMVRQRVYQMAAGYEDCNDADFLRIDRLFPWRTITGRCWPGVYRLIIQKASGRRGISILRIKKMEFSPQIVLSCHLREGLAPK